MLQLETLDLDDIAGALADQDDFERRWLLDPRTGELHLWSSDTGLDAQMDADDLDELDLVPIDPLPSYVWYQDMADFVEQISDEQASRRLGRAIRGRGAFRRFKDELNEEYPDLLPAWYGFRDVRARRRAVRWLLDEGLVDIGEAERHLVSHPDPDLP